MVHPNGYDVNGNPVYSDLGEAIEPRKDNTNNNIYESCATYFSCSNIKS